MFVSHTGTIHPSGFLPIICGMYPQQHVVSVYQNSPLFRRLRDANQLQGKCGECEFRQVCGGSRARAYAVTGNLMSQEPDCLYVPQRMSREIGSPS
jgi:radical SAM protein with 4Fe4S-binding SPASM domain